MHHSRKPLCCKATNEADELKSFQSRTSLESSRLDSAEGQLCNGQALPRTGSVQMSVYYMPSLATFGATGLATKNILKK